MTELKGLVTSTESREASFDKVFARQEQVIAEQQKLMSTMDESCKRMQGTIRLQKSLLNSFSTLSGLMCYKMADLAN